MDDMSRSASSASSFSTSMTQSFSSLKVREPSMETISSLGCSLQDEQFTDQKHPNNILSKIQVSLDKFVITGMGNIIYSCRVLSLKVS